MKKIKKILKNISFVVTTILLIFALLLVILSTIAKKNNKMFSIFGYSYSVVATPSMQPEINVGEIIIIKKLDYDDYLKTAQVGQDVVVYQSKKYNIYIVHKLYEITEEGLVLKGVNNPSPDDEIVNQQNFHGIVVSHGVQWFGNFLLSSRSLIFLVIVLFLIFVIVTEILPQLIKKQAKQESKLDDETRRLLEEQVRKEIEEEKNA
ncbi:MAG: signal peptidase I [Acholeplasmataceae bacterium]|jgi:signal peptidase